MDDTISQISAFAPMIISALKAIVVIIVGWFVASFISQLIKNKIVSNPRIDDTLGSFAASAARWVILLIVLIAVLQLFGIQATSLVAVLGAASLAIGLALQGTLSDLAAGVMLIVFRPYKIGQYVDVGGTAGTVKDISLFVTEMSTPDNVQILLPNSQAWGSVITNYSTHPTRRVDLTFGIDYDDDIDKAMGIIADLAAKDERIHSDPEPWVRVVNLGDSSVDLGVRVWVNAADYWEVKFAMTKKVKEGFDAGNISIPYPHSVEIQKHD